MGVGDPDEDEITPRLAQRGLQGGRGNPERGKLLEVDLARANVDHGFVVGVDDTLQGVLDGLDDVVGVEVRGAVVEVLELASLASSPGFPVFG